MNVDEFSNKFFLRWVHESTSQHYSFALNAKKKGNLLLNTPLSVIPIVWPDHNWERVEIISSVLKAVGSC